MLNKHGCENAWLQLWHLNQIKLVTPVSLKCSSFSCTVYSVFFWCSFLRQGTQTRVDYVIAYWVQDGNSVIKSNQFYEKIWARSHKEWWWWCSCQSHCFYFLNSQSRFSHRHCLLNLYSLLDNIVFWSQKYECARQAAAVLCFRDQSEGWILCLWIRVWVRNSEVSPKTTEASSDQRATGINYALLWMKPTKYWWGLLKCEVVPSGSLSEGH